MSAECPHFKKMSPHCGLNLSRNLWMPYLQEHRHTILSWWLFYLGFSISFHPKRLTLCKTKFYSILIVSLTVHRPSCRSDNWFNSSLPLFASITFTIIDRRWLMGQARLGQAMPCRAGLTRSPSRHNRLSCLNHPSPANPGPGLPVSPPSYHSFLPGAPERGAGAPVTALRRLLLGLGQIHSWKLSPAAQSAPSLLLFPNMPFNFLHFSKQLCCVLSLCSHGLLLFLSSMSKLPFTFKCCLKTHSSDVSDGDDDLSVSRCVS